MPDFAEKLGRRIRFIRQMKLISQTELARSINVTRPYLSKIEHGKYNVRLDTMEEICRGLRVQPAELLEGVFLEDI